MKRDAEKILVQPVRLVDLVEYQDDSIVSRTIMDERMGTMTLFAFTEGQGLNEHTAPFDALVHILEGETEVTVSAETFRLKKGDI